MTTTTIDGETASQTITINSLGAAPFTFSAYPFKGLGSLNAKFILKNRGNVAFKRIELSCNDGGPVSFNAPTMDAFSGSGCSYASAGTYRVRVTVFAQPDPEQPEQIIYTATQTVYVASVPAVHKMLRGVYTNMMNRLVAGNNVNALHAISQNLQSTFADIFSQLGPDLPTFAAQFGEIKAVYISEHVAQVILARDVNGEKSAFSIYLIPCEDGIWRIDLM